MYVFSKRISEKNNLGIDIFILSMYNVDYGGAWLFTPFIWRGLLMDKTIPVAPYQRIRKYVVRLINSCQGKPEQIMSEIQLCKTFKVSRNTVRKALKDLIEEGRLVIRPGIGTFINPFLSAYEMHAGHKYGMGKIHVWGLIIHFGHQVHWTYYDQQFMAGLFQETCSHPVYICPVTLAYSNENMIQEVNSLKLDGLVLLNSKTKTLPYLKKIKDELDIICVDHDEKPVWDREVVVEFFDYGKAAADALVKQGCKSPVFIEEAPDLPYSKKTLAGFRKGLENHGIELDKRFVLWKEDYEIKFNAMIDFNAEFDSVFATPHVYPHVAEILKKNKLTHIPVVTEASPINYFPEPIKPIVFKRPWDKAGKITGQRIKEFVAGKKVDEFSERIAWNII